MPDSPDLALIEAPGLLWRVERTSPPLRFSHINAVDAALPNVGNRFDVLGAGVLYAATQQEGAFAETLAGFRPGASLIAKMKEYGALPDDIAQVPRDWRLARRLRSLELPTALQFVDIDSPATHTYLTHHASDLLADLGVDHLDVATVRGPNRALTRSIASWIYAQTDEHGDALYAGLRYGSRLGPYECWAIFDGTRVELADDLSIGANREALEKVAHDFGLTVH
jgi:hypothetical protein